ncbi:MAG TPA: DUF4012 domain-containing protein, partial [Anaerolineae bacterium]|nr:DUF4012 domain-containing protein [Anaerolineae bacterium]
MLRLRNTLRRRIALGCGLVLVLLGCWCGLIAREALALKANLDQLQAVLSTIGDGEIALDSVHARLASLRTNLASLRDIGAPLLFIAPHLGWLPGIGQDVEAAPALLDGAIDLSEAGQVIVGAVQPLWPPSAANGQSPLAALVRGLQQARPQMSRAQAAAERAAQRLESIDTTSLSPALARQVERVSAGLPLLRSSLALIDLAPGLMGFDRPKTYIVLLQNADELRPTGGFITAVARLTLDRGAIVDLDVRDNAVDDFLHKPYDPPPQPLFDFMGSELWMFRDANWSPDFPTSARKAAELYTYGLGIPVDGVIGLNQRVVREILDGIGPVEVEPGRPPVDASNAITFMYESWSPPPDVVEVAAWIAGRKDFIGKLMNAILTRLETSPDQIEWADLGRGVLDALERRDLLIWVEDPGASAILARLGWDGVVRQVAGDYWMLVDANLGFNKANAVIDSSVAYTVTLQPDGSADATLAVHYRHTGPPARGCQHQIPYTQVLSYQTLVQACYWDYVRLLLPSGAQLQAATSHPVPADYLVVGRPFEGQVSVENELGKTVFATLFVLERGRSVDVALSYHLPSVADWSSESGHYTLTVQKQPGAMPRPVSVTLIWPKEYALSQASLPPVWAAAGSATFAFDLTTDRV